MSIKLATTVAALVLGSTLHAAALEGYDGDNNPVPATRSARVLSSDAYAAIPAPATRRSADVIGETKADTPNAVYWRGRLLGADPDPQVRLRILREAIGG